MDVVLIHSGVTDPREWGRVRPLLEPQHAAVTPALWQARPLAEIVLDVIPAERAALVGTSFGGRAALEATCAEPERVAALVLIGANPFGWSEEVQAISAQEDALFEAGRLDEAAALMVRAWLVGPERSEEDVDAELRSLVFAAQRAAYELEQPRAGTFSLADVRAPTLVMRGALDWPDVARAAARFVAEIDGAREVVIDGCAHLPALERPDALAQALLQFLDEVEGGRPPGPPALGS